MSIFSEFSTTPSIFLPGKTVLPTPKDKIDITETVSICVSATFFSGIIVVPIVAAYGPHEVEEVIATTIDYCLCRVIDKVVVVYFVIIRAEENGAYNFILHDYICRKIIIT